MSRITVFGAGAWGSTLAQVLCDAGNEVLLWGRNAKTISEINNQHTNQRYLAGQVLPHELRATTDLDEAFAFSQTYVLAIPSTQLRATLNEWKDRFSADCMIVSTLKGIEVSTMLRMTEIIEQVLGKHKVAILTGPNLADELILRQPAGAVAASTSQAVADDVRQIFRTPYYRVYTSVDLLGCELAGAVKNVIALAVGISIGMGFGENTQAMLITRGLNEVARLCAAHGSDPLSAAGLAGMGDLVATCSSPLSRNRSVGELLGRGSTMDQARAITKTTAEGVSSAPAVLALAQKFQVDMPIVEAVVDVVQNSLPPAEVVKRLMNRTTRSEY